MAQDASFTPKKISRRTMISFLAGSTAIFGEQIAGCGRTNPSKNSVTDDIDSGLPVKNSRMAASLKNGAPTLGIKRKYPGVFPSFNVKLVRPLYGLGSEDLPLHAASIVGLANQLQIVNLRTREVVHSVGIPESHHGGIESLVWDPQNKSLYLSTKSIIYSWRPQRPEHVSELGRVPGATTIYDLTLDSEGNLWGGTYPNGSVFCRDAKSKEIKVFPPFSKDSDYVRSLAVDSSGRIWAGTGSVHPTIYSFSPDDPDQVASFPLPETPSSGFVLSIQPLHSMLAISISGSTDRHFIDPLTRKWVDAPSEVVASSSAAAVVVATRGITYSIADQVLYSTNITKGSEFDLGRVVTGYPLSLSATKRYLIATSQSDEGLNIEIFNLQTKNSEDYYPIQLIPGELSVQSLYSHSDGNIYIGGHMGDRITALNPDTGSIWKSPASVSLINQVEGMIEFTPEQTYIGSYGSADLVTMNTNHRDLPEAYSRLIRLATSYKQSRLFAWAKNSHSVFFGSVPEYGVSGGSIGMIDPRSNIVSWVSNGDGSGFVKDHSIVSLAADEQFLYGTTSTRNGYGTEHAQGPACIFKFEIASRKLVWITRPMPNVGAIFGATLASGWLLVAVVEGIGLIDTETGEVAKLHTLTKASSASTGPGWTDASIAVLGQGLKVVHSAAGVATMVDFEKSTIHNIGPRESFNVGSRIISSNEGKIYTSQDQTTIVELDLDPIVGSSSNTQVEGAE